MDEAAEDEEICEPLKQGAPMKVWNSLGPEGKRKESQKALDELKKTARARNVEPERLAGTLLHR